MAGVLRSLAHDPGLGFSVAPPLNAYYKHHRARSQGRSTHRRDRPPAPGHPRARRHGHGRQDSSEKRTSGRPHAPPRSGHDALTLRPCYRATCDAPGCRAAEFVPYSTTECCHQHLVSIGWAMFLYRDNDKTRHRRMFVCPAHRQWRPHAWRLAQIARSAGNEERMREYIRDGARHAAALWMIAATGASLLSIAQAVGLSRSRVSQLVREYDAIIARRQRSAEGWIEPWAKRLREAGAIP